jgi:tRNA 2-thiouridine synthesizing protein D
MGKKKVTIILGSAPYQTERYYTTLRFVRTALVDGLEVNLFLFEDGVFVAKKGQDSTDFAEAEEWLKNAISEGAKVRACAVCGRQRGVKKEDLIDGVELVSMHELVAWVKDSDQTIFF